MAFLIDCPNCNERDVYEFRYGGEVRNRPGSNSSNEEWVSYLYANRNTPGEQKEWWYHSMGCRKWVVVLRDSLTNKVRAVSWPEEVH